MQAQAYGSLATYLNEQVLRGIESLAVRDIFGEEAYHQHIARHEMSGFHFTGYIAEYVRQNYLPNREEYPTFREFAPGLLEEMARLDPEDFPRLPAPSGAVGYHATVAEVLTGPRDSTIAIAICPGQQYLALPTVQNSLIRILDLHEQEFTWTFDPEDSLTDLGCPSWFSDGESILFRGTAPDGTVNLYSVRVGDETSLIQITDSVDPVSSGDVSPCGSVVAFVSGREGNKVLYLLDLDTEEATPLKDAPGDLMWPIWSPHGDMIALVDAERHRLGVVHVQEGDIEWWDLAPHTTAFWSRPGWLAEDQIVLPLNFKNWGYSVLASVCVFTGRTDLWAGPDMLAVYAAVPIPGEDVMLMTIRMFDESHRTYYRAVSRVSFERTAP